MNNLKGIFTLDCLEGFHKCLYEQTTVISLEAFVKPITMNTKLKN